MNNIEILEATMEDIEAIGNLSENGDIHHQAFPWLFKEEDASDKIEFFKFLVENDEAFLLKAVIDGKIVGYLTLQFAKMSDKTFYFSKYGYVGDIFVAEQYRKHGICSNMIAKAKDICKNHDIKLMKLFVFSFNKEAISVYEKSGFEELGHEMAVVLD